MKVEFVGSLLLFLVLFVFRSVRWAELALAALSFFLVKSDSFLGCFFVGALLSRARIHGFYDSLTGIFPRLASPVFMCVAFGVVGRYQLAGDQTLLPHVVAGLVLLVSIYINRSLVDFLSRNRFSQFLGRISYLLYLWHYVVLISLTSYLIVHFSDGGTLAWGTAISIGIATVLISILISASTMPLETCARMANRRLLGFLCKSRGALDEMVSVGSPAPMGMDPLNGTARAGVERGR